MAAGIFLAYRWSGGAKRLSGNDTAEGLGEMASRFGKLPSLWASLATLLVPIILIVVRSLLDRTLTEGNPMRGIFDLIGHPVIALPLGIILALSMARGRPRDEVNGWISNGIQRAASIMVIVGAGGVLGKVLQETGIGTFLGSSVLGIGIPPLLVVFLISALIKTGQGSSMVTMVTAPAIVLPILPTLNISPTLAAMAVSAGAMVCVNVNDSFFWVTTGFAEVDASTGYRTITAMSMAMGLVALAVIAAAAPLFGA